MLSAAPYCAAPAGAAQSPAPAAPREDAGAPRGAWFRDSRFAMFIHWGAYSRLAGRWDGKNYYGISEWIMNRARIPVAQYEKAAAEFNPVRFNATEWVKLAKAAGMRHIMITAKHHDGFAMFRSAVSKYNIADWTPFGRDPLKELAEACRAEGLRLGFYYSQTQDWHEAGAVGNDWDFREPRDFAGYLEAKAVPQVRELLKGYGPLAAIWFDTPGPITPGQSRMLVDMVHQAQPQCMVNSRIGNDLGDYVTLGDSEIPRLPRAGLWESVDTHNDSWGYAGFDLNYKSPAEVIERLVRVVSRGGVYMLNVGPDGEGRIPETSARVLTEVGNWVRAHSAAIHGAGPTPFGPLPWGEATTHGNTVYLHVFDWPADGRLIVPGLRAAGAKASLDGQKLAVRGAGGATEIALPASRPRTPVPVVTLETAGPIQASRELYVLGGHRNSLDAGTGKLTGCDVQQIRWMEKFGEWKHAEIAGNWQGPGSSVRWDFRTVEPGSYFLDVEYTAPASEDYSEWRVAIDGTSVEFPLIDSGERENRPIFNAPLPRFRPFRIGMIRLEQAGTHSLTLSPRGERGRAVRVSSFTLTPVR